MALCLQSGALCCRRPIARLSAIVLAEQKGKGLSGRRNMRAEYSI